jgi:ubiquinone/menaquinone biosynthesis C-methylase UbiE
MNPDDYDAWYDTPRGRWIGETEFALLRRLLDVKPGDSILDVGCGTGWFTRHLAGQGPKVTGLDHDPEWLTFARAHGGPDEHYVEGNALALPFPDASFDAVVSVAALCFVEDWPHALSEIVRVARRRFVLGLLNRHSLLYLQKGRHGGSGAYHGAHWHTRGEVLRTLAKLPVENIQTRTAIYLPSGSGLARSVETLLPQAFPFGGFLAVAGEVSGKS